ncbi:MAG: RluA family pseudouridine synthase [bacterium]
MEHEYSELSPDINDKGKRLDVFLANRIKSISREKAKDLINRGMVYIGGVTVQKPDYRIRGNESIIVDHVKESRSIVSPPPENIPLSVLYEDEYIMIINKPAGVSTHPTMNAMHNTVVNGLLYMNKQLSDMGDPLRRGIVHRLDKLTTGLLIIAKNNEAHINLLKMFKQRAIEKTYIAVTHNKMGEQSGVIDGFIERHPVDRKKMTTKTMHGRRAITSFQVIKRFDEATVLLLFPKTGRTHQLRTQLSDMGYPIVNDTVYSKRKALFRDPKLQRMALLLDGIALFAYALKFVHPVYNTPLSCSAPFPLWLKKVLEEHELS